MRKLLTCAVLALLVGASQYAQATDNGTPSSGSFTVNYSTNLTASSASGTLTINDVTNLLGTGVNIGAYSFVAGRDYQVGANTTAAATNLAAAINASQTNGQVLATASATGAVVTVTAQDVGSAYNSVGLRSTNSTEISASATTLTGGRNNASLSINGVTLIQGRDWFAFADSSYTAISIAEAIKKAPGLSQIIYPAWAGGTSGVVNVFSVLTPTAYSLVVADNSATNANLTPSGSTMTGGSAGLLQLRPCFLGNVDALPTSGYPAGCLLYLSSDATHIYVSTQAVTGAASAAANSWLAK